MNKRYLIPLIIIGIVSILYLAYWQGEYTCQSNNHHSIRLKAELHGANKMRELMMYDFLNKTEPDRSITVKELDSMPGYMSLKEYRSTLKANEYTELLIYYIEIMEGK